MAASKLYLEQTDKMSALKELIKLLPFIYLVHHRLPFALGKPPALTVSQASNSRGFSCRRQPPVLPIDPVHEISSLRREGNLTFCSLSTAYNSLL